MSRFELRDSRRLTGPNVIWNRPGPVIDVALDEQDRELAEESWQSQVRLLMAAVGWEDQLTASRHFPGGISLTFSAPMDVLYAACELNELAWEAAVALIDGHELEGLDDKLEAIKSEIRRERNPPLLRLQRAANRHQKLFLTCDEAVSIGAGRWSKTWPVNRLPEPGDVDWDKIASIPTAMVTGTNGKTTTVRLLRAMVNAQGKVPGMSSTDWLRVGEQILDRGDWSGPGGARSIMRNENVDVALLETARGGMLRRGLGLGENAADVALITNIAPDHLGEWGIQDLSMLAETKFVVCHAARSVVLNADDEMSVQGAAKLDKDITWFSLDSNNDIVKQHLASGGQAALLVDDDICWCCAGETSVLLDIHEIPIALDGAARHNIANALAAVAVAKHLSLSDDSILAALRGFQSSVHDNPGRMNRFELNGVQVIVDFAHNPHGLAALLAMTAAMPSTRRLVTIGHAGDRNDEAIKEVAVTAAASGVDHVIIKEQESVLRGRKLGEIPAMLEQALIASGYPQAQISHAENELEATEQALAWARPGDLLLLLTLSQRAEVLQRLEAEKDLKQMI